jgi:hypothetical protein
VRSLGRAAESRPLSDSEIERLIELGNYSGADEVKTYALNALRHVKYPEWHERISNIMVQSLKDSYSSVRKVAARGLALLNARETTPVLLEAYKHAEPEEKKVLHKVLVKLGYQFSSEEDEKKGDEEKGTS